ncbi:hypothetical protein AYO38_10605 [bacterium SCGC AG-212-C10]|nr:hypothetical protein AYO38_10605 [bacterium SCGC AG-212-C10]
MFHHARIRLSVFYAAALAVILIAIGGTAYLVLRRELDAEINRSLDKSMASLLTLQPQELNIMPPADPKQGGYGDRRGGIARVDPRDALSSDIFYLLTAGEDATVINNPRSTTLTSFPLAEIAEKAVATDDTGGARVSFDADGHRYRLQAVVVGETVSSGEAVTLMVGRSLDSRDHQLQVLAIVLAAGGVAGVLLAAGGGWLLAGRALVPIRKTLETQQRFVSDASHELRTPIAVMKANAELLLRHPDDTIENNVDQVAAIYEESDHLTRLVGDLLTLARADEQRLELIKTNIDLDDLLENLVRDMSAVADSKRVRLTLQSGAGDVEGDPQRIRQLALILLDNALKFTPEGGTVTIRARKDGSRAVFEVQDTGPGIAAKHLPKLFDRFYRADEARSPEGGTGLGLSIARWIAEAHGGRIAVESAPGAGATFSVRLPSAHRRPKAVAAEDFARP